MNPRASNDSMEAEAASSLSARLRERIRNSGPITFKEWMSAALYDEREGYYRRRGAERWGRAGDYRTAPERSTLFAATFARHFAKLYEELGSPGIFHLLEAGGGVGRFAHGILHTLQRDAPHVYDSLRYVFDEASADARARAASLLSPFAEKVEFRSFSRTEAPLDAAVVFSNELLDAFPVHRVTMRGGRLRESFVKLDEDGGFVFVESEPTTPRLEAYVRRMCTTPAEGQVFEVNFGAGEWIARAAALLGRGFVVTVDYGSDAGELYDVPQRRAGTLRAFRSHELTEDVLHDPGSQDLTTTVNWTQVVDEGRAADLDLVSIERLDAFLLRAGLLEQLELAGTHAASEAEIVALRLGAREMILPGGMASYFQVLVQQKGRARSSA